MKSTWNNARKELPAWQNLGASRTAAATLRKCSCRTEFLFHGVVIRRSPPNLILVIHIEENNLPVFGHLFQHFQPLTMPLSSSLAEQTKAYLSMSLPCHDLHAFASRVSNSPHGVFLCQPNCISLPQSFSGPSRTHLEIRQRSFLSRPLA